MFFKRIASKEFLLLPLLDLLFVGFLGLPAACSMTTFPLSQPLIAFVNLISAWIFLLSVSLISATASSKISQPVLRKFMKLFVGLLVMTGVAYCVLFWMFFFEVGYGPNRNLILFVVFNSGQVFLHALQTSPVTFSIISMVILLSTAVFAIWHQRLADQLADTVSMKRFAGAAIMALGIVLLTAPYLYLRLSSVAVDRYVFENMKVRRIWADNVQNMKNELPEKIPYHPRPSGLNQGPVIIVLVESLRHDLLEMEPSPILFLKSLSSESVVFERSYASSSHSNYADLAIWYSQYPLRFKNIQQYPVDAPWRGKSIFEAFKTHGYQTAYISSQNEKWGDMVNRLKWGVDYFYHSEDYHGPTWVNKDDRAGLVRLMENGCASAGKIEDSETLRVAAEWIAGQAGNKKIFLGLNLQNTHFSYVIPPGGDEPFQPAVLDFETVYYSWPQSKKDIVKNRYLNAAFNVDRLLREFSEELKKLGVWDDCLFVVIGDSGEAFYEHGVANHSGPMFEEVMRTVSLARVPANIKSSIKRITTPISHIDIGPWVLSQLDMPIYLSGEREQGRRNKCFANLFVCQCHGSAVWGSSLALEIFKNRVPIF